MVEGVDIAARLSMQQGNPPAKTISPGIFGIFGGAIQRPSLQAYGLFTGQVGGPFGLKPKQSAMTAQMAYEQQVMSRMKQDGDSVLAQAMAAAGPIQGTIQGTGNIFEGNGLGGMGRGGGSFLDV